VSAGSGSVINRNMTEMIRTMTGLIEQKSPSLLGHSQRVAAVCKRFCRKLELPKKEAGHIYLAGLLHDIGMIYVPDNIIQKQDSLTADETGVLRKHPVIAETILANIGLLQGILPIIRHHHEACDGSGYPDALKGEAIPLGARILCIADCFDALSSGWPRQGAGSPGEALEEMRARAGSMFDETLFKEFAACIAGAPEDEAASGARPAQERQLTAAEVVKMIVEKYRESDIELPVLPQVVQEIGRVLKQPHADSNDLATVIERDAGITVKLISVANSPMYRGAEKIQTVRQAIPRLGIKEARNSISANAARNVFKTADEDLRKMMEKVWLHSLACAYSSRELAGKLGLGDEEKYFLMGLIHDIGKVLLIKGFNDMTDRMEDGSPQDIADAVQEAHTSFGGAILQRLGFTPDYIKIAESHEAAKYFETTKKEILVISLANMLTRKTGFSPFEYDGRPLSGLESARLLGADEAVIGQVADATGDLMQTIAGIF